MERNMATTDQGVSSVSEPKGALRTSGHRVTSSDKTADLLHNEALMTGGGGGGERKGGEGG